MTPEKKALELMSKYSLSHQDGLSKEQLNTNFEQSKKFAMICVDEILNDNPNIYDSDRLNHKYWKEVKKQIESSRLEELESEIDDREYYKSIFMLFYDGSWEIEPMYPDFPTTYQLGVTKLEYFDGSLHVYLRQPGLLIGRMGKSIELLEKHLGCSVKIHEVDLLKPWRNL